MCAFALTLAACDDGGGSDANDGAADGDPDTTTTGGTGTTGEETGTDTGDDGPPPPEAFDRWIKIELPGTTCSDGSQYKFWVNWHEGATDLAVFMEPGGACWDYPSCSGQAGILGAANPNGLGDDHMSLWGFYTPLINRGEMGSLEDWNLVFLPYCTGDVHTGDKTTVYTDPEGAGEDVNFVHGGHPNVQEAIGYLNEQFPAIDRFLLDGCSAGGAGSQINYFFFRTMLNIQRGYLINDSGPIFPNSANSEPLHQEIRSVWGVDPVIDLTPEAGRIKDDFGDINAVLAEQFPEDRLGITYFVRDYNYSRYSYERFYDGIDRDGIHQRFYEDTLELMDQYDAYDNLSYYIPYERLLNDSHCTTIFSYVGTEIEDNDVGQWIDMLLDDSMPLQSFADLDGSKASP